MSDAATNDFVSRIAQLSSESADHRRKARAYRNERDNAQKELEALRKQLEATTAERDGLSERLKAAPSELQKKLDELQGKLRLRDHKDAFNRLAREANVADAAVDDLWALSGWKAETDVVDEAALKDVIGAAVAARPYLVQTAGGTPAPTPPAPKPGPGVSRGAPDTSPAGFVVTRSQLGDVRWVSQNWNKLETARQAGDLVVQPD